MTYVSLSYIQYLVGSGYIIMTYVSLSYIQYLVCVMVMVFNATFNNISVISWQSVLLVKIIRVHGKNHRPAASH
jgi:hypothetical protein